MSITHDAQDGSLVALQKSWILALAQLRSVLDRTERSLRFARECQYHVERHGHIAPEDLDRLSRRYLGVFDDR